MIEQDKEMTQEEIKSHCENCYAMIKGSNDFLKELRSKCKHPNTFEGNYSWRVGCIDKANICSDCGELINVINKYILPTQTTN